MLFDGDKAGINATLRGIDIILSAGLNVKICSFPNGEDPDSYSQGKSEEEINDYLEKNSKDFIQYKASILAQTSKEDPKLMDDLLSHNVVVEGKQPEQQSVWTQFLFY